MTLVEISRWWRWTLTIMPIMLAGGFARPRGRARIETTAQYQAAQAHLDSPSHAISLEK